jgi:hypothetical protein
MIPASSSDSFAIATEMMGIGIGGLINTLYAIGNNL